MLIWASTLLLHIRDDGCLDERSFGPTQLMLTWANTSLLHIKADGCLDEGIFGPTKLLLIWANKSLCFLGQSSTLHYCYISRLMDASMSESSGRHS